MKNLIPAMIAITFTAALAFTGCGTRGEDLTKNPAIGVIANVATDVGLQLLAGELRRKNPESAEAILLLLRAVQANVFAGAAQTLPAWPDDRESEELAVALEAALDSRLEESQRESAIAAVIAGLEGSK